MTEDPAADRIRSDPNLHEIERFLRQSQEAGQCGSWEIDLATRRAKWSAAMCRIHGLEHDFLEAAQSETESLVHPADRAPLQAAVARFVEAHCTEDLDLEYRIVRPDGGIRTLWARGKALLDADRRPVRLVGIAADITERKRAEQAQRATDLFLKTVLDASPNIIFVKDGGGRVLFANELAVGVYVAATAQPSAEGPQGLTPADRAVLRNGQQIDRDELILAGGAPRWFHTVRVPLVQADGSTAVLGIATDITERKNTEQTLERVLDAVTPITGPDFFRSLAHQLSEACGVEYAFIASLDPQDRDRGRTVAVSRRGKLIDNFSYDLAHTPWAEIVGKSLCHYPTNVQQAFPEDRLLAELGIDAYMAIPLFANSGKPLGLVALMHDRPIAAPGNAAAMLRVVAARASVEIERDAAEKALRDRENLFRGLLETAPIPMLVTTLADERRIVSMNRAFSDVFGYTMNDVHDVASWWHRAYPDPEYRRRIRDAWAVALAAAAREGSSSIEPVEAEVTCLDGSRRYVAVHMGAFGDRALVMFNDLTIHKQVEETLRVAREQWQQTFDTLREYICVLDPAGRIVQTNRAMREQFAPIHGELVGLDFRLVYFGTATPRPETPCTAVLTGALAAADCEGPLPALPGRFAVACYPLTKNGRAHGAVHVVRDITRAHELEEQLRQSQKLQAIGQLAGGVAHDFNNLLTVILGLSDRLLAAMPDMNDPLRGTVVTLHETGERAAVLTRQLLLFGRKAVVTPRVLDMNEVLRGTSAILPRVIGEDIALTFAFEPSLPAVEADAGQLEQVILNLSLNARDAMPSGGQLRIETRAVTFTEADSRHRPALRPGHFVELSVGDTGGGIAPEVAAHLFEPFFTTKEQGKGTGLGLATVHGIVQQFGGFITFDTAIGAGTTFRVFLPAAASSTAPSAVSSGVSARGGSETILLVEDDAFVRDIMRFSLETCGYELLEASSGAEALEIAERHRGPIDLLMTDVVMPGMNGTRVAELLRARRKGLRVLFMTGYAGNEHIDSAMSARDGILHKPFMGAALTEKVREILDGR